MGPSVRRVDDVGRRLLCLLHESSLTLTHHGVRVLGQFGNEVGVVLQHPIHQGSESLRPRAGSHRGLRLLHQALHVASRLGHQFGREPDIAPQFHIGLNEFQKRLDHFGWYEIGLHVRLHHRTSCGDPKSGNSGRHLGGKKAMPVSLRCQGRPSLVIVNAWIGGLDRLLTQHEPLVISSFGAARCAHEGDRRDNERGHEGTDLGLHQCSFRDDVRLPLRNGSTKA